MILKYGLNLNTKKSNKPAAATNVFDQLKPKDEPEHTVASQIATQNERQRQKAEHEKLMLLAEDPNVYAYDDVYESMAEKKRGQIAAKLSADADRKPKYFDKFAKRVEERNREQAVIYQRNIVKERIVEDEKFSQTEAFITSSYKNQMIKDKAWQTQQDLIDRRNTGPTVVGMAGGFLSHILNEPPASPASLEPEAVRLSTETAAVQEKGPVIADKKKVSKIEDKPVKKDLSEPRSEKLTKSLTQPESRESPTIGTKRGREQEPSKTESKSEDYVQEPTPVDFDVKPKSEARAPSPPRPSKEELAAAARERYLKRKAQRQTPATAP